ncbi:type II toxin-antitoxin system death-on-curing family toxin [Noviherbaspirillum saxi]|uniref:Type II toxin-antitoxin system death-on-curing family toxin n=1 Tax=Noviherbaspirillum saxi TaxID=2320863 RepID=A0A3A3FH31_9BURK|nr:type II toxin-antitoxin system death-on-curing family toxin [Noviherbaspirillum saxi]RJF92480.1 type II toxin-antitoxin system death-on-curing family toxin [Noviherbaspirillum saxi]
MSWEWIPPSIVYAIHDKQLAEHGGIAGVKDYNLIESALARPQQLSSYGNPPPDAADLAAAYAFGIARNHGFNDGNKRTAWILARLFLALNKCTLQFDQSEAYATVMSLAAGSLGEREFAQWLRQRII